MTIAFIVVVLDVLIGFLFYFGLQHIKVMQLLTNQDINESIVMAQDFSVVLVGLPTHTSVRSLKAEMWNWIEKVNEKES
jgi:Na+/H+ antiporter NhaC